MANMAHKANNDNYRPWGFFEVLSDEKNHKVKRITVYPGKRLSLQLHEQRSEHWLIIQGKAYMTLDKKEFELNEGQSVNIGRKSSHRIKNIGHRDLIFIEIQTGEYFGEDDIRRIEDDFGRI